MPFFAALFRCLRWLSTVWFLNLKHSLVFLGIKWYLGIWQVNILKFPLPIRRRKKCLSSHVLVFLLCKMKVNALFPLPASLFPVWWGQSAGDLLLNQNCPTDEKMKVKLNLLILESKSIGFYISKDNMSFISRLTCYVVLSLNWANPWKYFVITTGTRIATVSW